MSFILYPHSVDDADIVYDETHDTNYGEERLNDRNKNDLFKDSAVGDTTCVFTIDLESGNSRTADYLILGNYMLSNNGFEADLKFYDSANEADYTELTDSDTLDESLTHADKKYSLANASDRRYFKLSIEYTSNIVAFELGNIFFGAAITLTASFNLDTSEVRTYKNISSENLSGYRFSQIINKDNPRRIWTYDFEYLTNTEKGYLETFADEIYATDGLSHYPFFFSPDSGTTLYFARMRGSLQFTQIAYQRYRTQLIFEEEL